jgi:Aldo/keto reductase family
MRAGPGQAQNSWLMNSNTYPLAGRRVNRVGYGAMQLPAPGVFGPPRDRQHALAVLRYVVETGANHVDTAYYYGLGVANELIHEALHPYPADRLIIEYGDYECPYFRQAFHAIEQVERQLGGTVRFAFRHFPRAGLPDAPESMMPVCLQAVTDKVQEVQCPTSRPSRPGSLPSLAPCPRAPPEMPCAPKVITGRVAPLPGPGHGVVPVTPPLPLPSGPVLKPSHKSIDQRR